ncbi:tRNA pseudouridine synthase 1 [Coemansia sp. Benny D115]|nr:tRNA pseudouridine synthase 1 [Coemansia sp. Benny D115]
MPDKTIEAISPETVVSPKAEATVQSPGSVVDVQEDTNVKKRYNRGQTCRDRREFAKKKRLERNLEKQETRVRTSESSEPRLPKRRVALLIGFCGTGFQGMQVNPNARTIEGELFQALVKAGAVSADNSTDQSKVQLHRAARTDKGVHAAGQVVSLKMIIEDNDIVAKINQHLPDQIRAWGYVRVIRSFNAKTMCDARVYEYLVPTYVFGEPSAELAEIARTVPFGSREMPETTEEEMREKRKYRISPEQLEYLRQAFGRYAGTHDYRNFTVTKGCTDSNSRRCIHWFTVSDPMLIDGVEWLSLKVKGQSFMLHQIRKMVGLVILMARGQAPLKLMDLLLASTPRVNVPKAPGVGLLLECPVFDGYNKRGSEDKRGATDPVSFDQYKETMDKFKQQFIYDKIVDMEMKEAVFDVWVKNTELAPEQYTYINKEGVIPEDAIVTPETERKWQEMRRAQAIAAAAAATAAGTEAGSATADAGAQGGGLLVESSEDEEDSKDN